MLEAIKICKSFPGSPNVLDQISLNVQAGEFLTLLGPSGCGKTTFLRTVSGLEKADSGELLLNGQSIMSKSAQERPFHMVFQKYALFPHMNVSENIEFSLRNKNVDAAKRKARVKELLEMMQLPAYELRMPESLSGGQSQRIALARALADNPQILLLDEPFSALDEKLKIQLRTELKSLQKKLGLTFVFVTHDQQEALQMSDRIAIFNLGRIEQIGTPEDLFYRPQTSFVAEFIGQKNKVNSSTGVRGYLNPEKLLLTSDGEIKGQGNVELVCIAGPYYEIRIQDHMGHSWIAYVENRVGSRIKAGQSIQFSYNKTDLIYVTGNSR